MNYWMADVWRIGIRRFTFWCQSVHFQDHLPHFPLPHHNCPVELAQRHGRQRYSSHTEQSIKQWYCSPLHNNDETTVTGGNDRIRFQSGIDQLFGIDAPGRPVSLPGRLATVRLHSTPLSVLQSAVQSDARRLAAPIHSSWKRSPLLSVPAR